MSLPTLSLALKRVQIKRSSTSLNSMAMMTRICLTALILFVEEFGPELKYIKGENNFVADALSRLEKSDNKEILTSLSSMAKMKSICLTAPIQFVITTLPKHRKLMLNYNKS